MTIPDNLKAARAAIPLIDAYRVEALFLAPGRPHLRALAKAGVPMLALRWTAATAAYTRAVREYLQGDPARLETFLEWLTTEDEASQPAN
ncbi:hypothetical protein [Corynebacterium flavescens]|uniref:hypothetical protein n=1 Tax=Corynebacterium flavescens TaxID=28028 RepID=UPI003FD3BF2D